MATRHVIVQHSGYGYAGHAQFQKGLETREVKTAAEQRKVEKAGGIMFDRYSEAEEWCEAEMYAGTDGLIPNAPGAFADLQIDRLAVYVPQPSTMQALDLVKMRDELAAGQ